MHLLKVWNKCYSDHSSNPRTFSCGSNHHLSFTWWCSRSHRSCSSSLLLYCTVAMFESCCFLFCLHSSFWGWGFSNSLFIFLVVRCLLMLCCRLRLFLSNLHVKWCSMWCSSSAMRYGRLLAFSLGNFLLSLRYFRLLLTECCVPLRLLRKVVSAQTEFASWLIPVPNCGWKELLDLDFLWTLLPVDTSSSAVLVILYSLWSVFPCFFRSFALSYPSRFAVTLHVTPVFVL